MSIGVPVYNGSRYLAAALDALVAQDHEELEIIVADNASTDDSVAIGESRAAHDDRVRVLTSPVNRGAAWNFNRTLAVARGSYFKWAAADDLVAPTFVSACLRGFATGPSSTVLCYPKTTTIDEEGYPVGDFEDELDLPEATASARLAHFLSVRTEYHPVFGLIRRSALERTRAIGSFVASDIVLLAELCLLGQFREIPERLFLRRFHAATSVRANPGAQARAEWFDPARRGGSALPWTRVTTELARSVARADLPFGERLRAEGALARRWALPWWRVIGGEVRAAARTRVRGCGPAPVVGP